MKSRFLFSFLVLITLTSGVSAQELKAANPKDIALFPQQNDIRNTLNLSGIWKFKKDSAGVGEKEKWYTGLNNYRSIAVPGSWNDQFDDMHSSKGLG